MASVFSRRIGRSLQVRLYSAAARPEAKEPQLSKQGAKLTKLPNGLVVASLETYSPLSRIALVAKAGPRFENGDNLGVTHCLRIAAGLSTQNMSSFGMTRSLEQVGANFTCTSSREYMFYRVECIRDNLELATEVLRQVTTAPAFKPWELTEIQNRLKLDLAILKSQPATMVYDLLHQAAFRKTLGNSLYAPDFMVGKYSREQLLNYMKSYYSTGRVALVGVGVDHEELVECAQKFTPFASAATAADKATYGGGEIRVNTGGSLAYVAVAVEGPSLAGKELLHAAVLQNVMGLGPSIKYSTGGATSLLTQAITKATSQPFAVSCLNANYTDNGLFGFFAIAQATEMEKVLQAAFKQFAAITKNGLDEKEVARGKYRLQADFGMYMETSSSLLQQLKARIAMQQEQSENSALDFAEQALSGEQLVSPNDLFTFIEGITTADVTNVAKKLVNGTPTMAAVGNLSHTPYLDQFRK
ncbi:cytochrome b-c1 complex subunit 2, mitochondrial-like isoform X2 [Pomacea canaliculata]|uniref:cytochrome b-c1 complex subunit 2, mitochondrial-like isoform X2 n=1 Tax=Pomacea canaliculata TaxID=400727 RepID=UPI000D7374BB|nr:cytochrome b-c1 complex subunit 2, mitochondrial-like isoform X2 [Pomacea canaliculata]